MDTDEIFRNGFRAGVAFCTILTVIANTLVFLVRDYLISRRSRQPRV